MAHLGFVEELQINLRVKYKNNNISFATRQISFSHFLKKYVFQTCLNYTDPHTTPNSCYKAPAPSSCMESSSRYQVPLGSHKQAASARLATGVGLVERDLNGRLVAENC